MPDKYTFPVNAAPLTPHEPPILMVETIDSIDDDAKSAVIGLTIRQDNPFVDQDGELASEALLEIMAQAAAAQDGFNIKRDGGTPGEKGFITGISKFAATGQVKVGDQLTVKVELGPQFEALSVVFCETHLDNKKIASAEITVWKAP